MVGHHLATAAKNDTHTHTHTHLIYIYIHITFMFFLFFLILVGWGVGMVVAELVSILEREFHFPRTEFHLSVVMITILDEVISVLSNCCQESSVQRYRFTLLKGIILNIFHWLQLYAVLKNVCLLSSCSRS